MHSVMPLEVLPVMKPTVPISATMLRARAYFNYSDKPQYVRLPVVTHFQKSVQLPVPEALHRDIHYQTKIHNIYIHASDGRKKTTFRVFFQRHHRLLLNPCVEGIRGHVIVARSSRKDPEGVVNLRAGDSQIIEKIIPRLIPMIHRFQSRRKQFRPSVDVAVDRHAVGRNAVRFSPRNHRRNHRRDA